MGYYFSVWGIVTLMVILLSVIAGWIFITPERVTQWSAKIPEFSVTIQDGILTETGLLEDPSVLVDEQDFMIVVSKTLTQLPPDEQKNAGIYILKDHIAILQSEGM